MSERSATALGDALRAGLSKHARVHAWQVSSVVRSGLQTYLVETRLEAERVTEDEWHEFVVFVKNGESLGRAAVTLTRADAGRLGAKIDEAVYMASLGADEPWKLPGAGEVPRVEVFDAALSGAQTRATSKELTEAWRAAVSAAKGVRPSSMELFCDTETVAFENSAGLSAHSSTTLASLLTIVLAANGGREAESVSWERRRRASDLDVQDIVRRASEEARDLTRAEVPPSGDYPVVIDASEIGALFSPLRANASAESLYRKSSRFEIGKPLPIEGTGGEPLVVISNATAPYGLSSYAVDGDGVAARRVEIVKDGVFTRPWATKQFADYLGTEATGGFGNLEIPPGKTALADLLAGDGPVLHVREFSWLTPDQARGNFGTEVRVGYLHEKGKRKPVKGGSVSGSVFGVLGSARYARESVFLGNYLGAAAVRLEGLSVSGA